MNSLSFGGSIAVPVKQTRHINLRKEVPVSNAAENSDLENGSERINISYESLAVYLNLLKACNIEICQKNDDFASIKNRIVLSDYDKKDSYSLVEVDTQKFDECFKNSDEGNWYIRPHLNNFQYRGVENYLKTLNPIDATSVKFVDNRGFLEVNILDGRHRFAVMRDMGMKSVIVAMDEDSKKLVEKYGLLTK